jgi:undecaprenyl-diphosphatase
MNSLELLNRALFLRMDATMASPAWLIQLGLYAADELILALPLLLALTWLWGDGAARAQALKACAVAALALALSQGIGGVWPHPRPFVLGLGHTWLAHAADTSFPSDHMSAMTAVGLSFLWGGLRRRGAAVLLMAAATGWARVFVGVHFPLDIAGGVAVAALAYLGVTPLWWWLGTPVTAFAQRLYRRIFARPIARNWLRY